MRPLAIRHYAFDAMPHVIRQRTRRLLVATGSLVCQSAVTGVFVAFAGDRVAGVAAYRVCGKTMTLHAAATAFWCRRQGVYARLVRARISLAGRLRLRRVTAVCRVAAVPVLNTLLPLGFRICKIIADPSSPAVGTTRVWYHMVRTQ